MWLKLRQRQKVYLFMKFLWILGSMTVVVIQCQDAEPHSNESTTRLSPPLWLPWLTYPQSRHVVIIYYLRLQYCHHCGNCWNLVSHTLWIYGFYSVSSNAWSWCLIMPSSLWKSVIVRNCVYFRSSLATASFTELSLGRQDSILNCRHMNVTIQLNIKRILCRATRTDELLFLILYTVH